MKKQILFAGAAAGLALACALPASAQSIDYGSLQTLFNEPVTTSATGSPQRASAAPVDMDIISAEDIKRSGATDLPTILSRVAGVDVQNWSAGQSDVGVRGYDQPQSPRLLVLVNGRQAYLDHYGYTAWSTLPVQLEEIRQIEVVKGPNSALFGFNAVAGVVNIITYNPKFDDVGFASFKAGSNGLKEGNFGATAKLGDRLSARLTAGAAQEPEWARTGGIVGGQRDFERVNANLDLVAQVTDKLEARIEGGWSNVQQTDVGSSYNYIPAKYLNHSIKGALAWDSQYGLVQLSAYQNDLTVKADLGSGATAVFENTIKVVSLQDLFKVGAKHTFRLGVEYRQNEMPTAPIRGGVLSYDVLAFSGMWNWQVRDDFALTAALRNDSLEMKREGTFPPGYPGATNALFDRSIEETSWNLGAVWNVTDVDTVRATYARGVQVPTLMSLGGLQLVFPGVAIVGNPQLDPTLVTNYGLAYERALPKIGGKASARVFFQESEAIRGEPAPTAPGINAYMNVSDSELKGVELLAEGAYATGVRWKANYTYTDVEDEVYAGFDIDARLASYEELTPKHRANLNVGWSNEAWSVDGFLRYESEKTMYGEPLLGSPKIAIDDFVTVGGRVARDFDNGVTLAVAGQNLLDERQRQTPGLEVERRAVFSLTKTW